MALLKRLVRQTTAITNETWQQIKTAHASGIGLRELARNAGVPEGTVLSRAKREGWMRQIQSAKALAKREDVLDATPVESSRDVDGGTRRAPRGANGGHIRDGRRSHRDNGRPGNPQLRR